MALLELKGVSKGFASRPVLRDVHLSVEEREFVAVVGASASGKTTLLKIAAGLLYPDQGSVSMAGAPVVDFSREAAIVFQNYSLLPWLSALENVRLAVEGAYPEWTAARHTEHSRLYLDKVGLGAACDKKPNQLSGGMRQRVAIARAFAVEPRFLFLDEPFGALDALTRATLQRQLLDLAKERPVTTLMITNNMDEARLLGDRVFALGRESNSLEAC
jgi:nitrate/nitrite transport system ATP-binding protein